MQLAAHCRKCGRVMNSQRIDTSQVRMSCSCGFSDFRAMPETVQTANPFYRETRFTPHGECEKEKMTLIMHRASREHLEIISLEEISMLVCHDFELAEVLQSISTKLAGQLNADVCNIYLPEGEDWCSRQPTALGMSISGKSASGSVKGLPAPWPERCSR